MIALVDYGMGNLRSVANAFEALGERVVITHDPQHLREAVAIILPGVGAFGDGMRRLEELGLVTCLHEEILIKRKPYLGICLGMQFVATESLEDGSHRGFNWIRGTVRRIVSDDPRYKVPHIGWNELTIERPGGLFANVPAQPVFYFVHSYYVDVAAQEAAVVTATCWHGVRITASVQKGHIFGVQFHPEKSQQVGLQVLKNFLTYVYHAEETSDPRLDFAGRPGRPE